jgi:deazaflavin-dependent oxidoreductase (nitroreductase family)
MYMGVSRRATGNPDQYQTGWIFQRLGGTIADPEVPMAKRSARPFSPTEEKVLDVAVKIMSRVNVWLLRASGGRVGSRFRYGAPVMLLTTIGRRSGQPRTTPLIYLEDGENVVTVASKGGSARHPLWYRNLRDHPDVEVEIGAQRRQLHARTASAEEKTKLWPRLAAIYPDYDDYQARTERDIPVVILEPR